MSRESFKNLAADFNRTTQAWAQNKVSAPFMLTKYAILLDQKAETPEDRKLLAETLYRGGLQWLHGLAEGKGNLTVSLPDDVKGLFAALTAQPNLEHMPREAPQNLADAGLALLRRAETTTGWHTDVLVQSAAAANACASQFKILQKDLPAPAQVAPVKKKEDAFSL